MKKILIIPLLFVPLFIFGIQVHDAHSQIFNSLTYSETDTEAPGRIFFFFDLRSRDSFIQLTLPDSSNTGNTGLAHIQIFDVSNNCNENDFFDNYTPRDTHTYNLRNIQTNDGNPSGVVLPEGAYGIVAVTMFDPSGLFYSLVGNLRILDQNGYEYRTNGQAVFFLTNNLPDTFFYSLNFNQEGGIIFSDIVGVTIETVFTGIPSSPQEFNASNITESYIPLDIDIFDNNEVPFSCRNVIFACVNSDSSRYEELLEAAAANGAGASVASFDYGINETIPHSKGGELLCPGNVIGEGIVKMSLIDQEIPAPTPIFLGFVGLNNGNSRGSLDSFFQSENDFALGL